MTTTDFIGAYDGKVHYIDSPLFVFSSAPVIVEMPDAPDGYPYQLSVINLNTQKQYDETRYIHNGRANFELSHILQYLAKDELSQIFSESVALAGTVTNFKITITEVEDGSAGSFTVLAILGACDELESYAYAPEHPQNSPATRRMWMNYPQTVNMHSDYDDLFYVKTPGGDLRLDVSPDYSIAEIDLLQELRSLDSPAALEVVTKLNKGVPVTLGLPVYYQVSRLGEHIVREDHLFVRFIPDLTPLGEGTYLRWLQRDGSFGYWLFQNGEISVAANESNAFLRAILTNPAEPSEYGTIALFDRNASQADFSESQTLSLGTYVDNSDEFDYLLGLATSPMVDRLVYLEAGKMGWQRVNIAPGSYARSRKRTTPHRSAFEISIILPQRNTIKL